MAKGILNFPCRIDEDTYAMHKAKAAACKMKLADYVRAAIDNYKCESGDQSTDYPRKQRKLVGSNNNKE